MQNYIKKITKGKILPNKRRNTLLWRTNKHEMYCLRQIPSLNTKLSLHPFKPA